MQNETQFTKIENHVITDLTNPLNNETVILNDSFQIRVALAFINDIAQNQNINVSLINTISAGHNSYMTLQIPADTFEKYNYETSHPFDADYSYKLDADTYMLYTDFANLSDQYEIEI